MSDFSVILRYLCKGNLVINFKSIFCLHVIEETKKKQKTFLATKQVNALYLNFPLSN